MQFAKPPVERVWEGLPLSLGGGDGHLHENIQKLTFISCNLGHSGVIFMTFSEATPRNV